MNEMTHLTAEELVMLAKANSVVPKGAWSSFYKAKYGEWHVSVPAEDSDTMRIALFRDGCPGGQTYTEFIAAANPDAVLKLLADLNAARAKLAKLEAVAVMAMTPHRDAYDQYHDWHGGLPNPPLPRKVR